MSRRRTLTAYGITPYRVTIALTNQEWDKLRHEAETRKVTGTQLIEIILNDVCVALPDPPRVQVDEPLPADPGDDLVDVP